MAPKSREFLRSLFGPHVLIAFLVGVVQGWLVQRFLNPSNGYPLADWLARLDPRAGVPLALGLTAAAAAVLAKRLTGNTLVSACAGALLILDPIRWIPGDGPVYAWAALRPDFGDLCAAACGLFAAGVRLLPSVALEQAPLLGRREALAIGALVAGSFASPAILAMPLLILIADLAYSPAGPVMVLRRTGIFFPLHLAAVVPAFLFRESLPIRGPVWLLVVGGEHWPFHYEHAHPVFDSGFGLVITIATFAGSTLLLVLLRRRVAKTLIVAGLFALAWTAAAEFPRFLVPADRHFAHSILSLFGVALLIPTILWRIAVASTVPRRLQPVTEAPLPAVPALRDLIRGMRSEARPAVAVAPSRKIDPTTGVRSTVESAVAAAVSATLEQIRLAFRGAHKDEGAGTPERVLWNRLLTTSSGGVAPAERPEDALIRWKGVFEKEIKPKIAAKSSVLCVGATPWPLVVAIAGDARSVLLVERGSRQAARAADDLATVGNVTVVRHDSGLGPIKDASVDAILCLVETAAQSPARNLALLGECKRVLKRHGIVGFGYADLSLPESQEALVRGTASEALLNRQAVETLGRLAGFGRFEHAHGALPLTSIAWLREPPRSP